MIAAALRFLPFRCRRLGAAMFGAVQAGRLPGCFERLAVALYHGGTRRSGWYV